MRTDRNASTTSTLADLDMEAQDLVANCGQHSDGISMSAPRGNSLTNVWSLQEHDISKVQNHRFVTAVQKHRFVTPTHEEKCENIHISLISLKFYYTKKSQMTHKTVILDHALNRAFRSIETFVFCSTCIAIACDLTMANVIT